ncbi:MAG: NTP transferase domain-containing protein, partial [Terriglobales bacterium]
MAKTKSRKQKVKEALGVLPPPRTAIAIMAAGKGTRLKSRHPKVLHEVAGKPILAHVIATARQVVPASDIFVIVGHEA